MEAHPQIKFFVFFVCYRTYVDYRTEGAEVKGLPI